MDIEEVCSYSTNFLAFSQKITEHFFDTKSTVVELLMDNKKGLIWPIRLLSTITTKDIFISYMEEEWTCESSDGDNRWPLLPNIFLFRMKAKVKCSAWVVNSSMLTMSVNVTVAAKVYAMSVYRAMINYLNQSSLNDFAFYGIPPASFSNSALIAIYKLTLRLTAVRLA